MEIEGVPLLVMFDPPHVAKSDRNNLLEKDLELDFQEVDKDKSLSRKIVSWDIFEKAYDMDRNSDSMERYLPKLTEEHVRPKLIKKMKVSYSLNVLSQSMSSFINLCLQTNGKIFDAMITIPITKKRHFAWLYLFVIKFYIFSANVNTSSGSKSLPPEAIYAAKYSLFRDRLFDSVNGQSLNPDKPLRGVLSDESIHINFWNEAKQTLKNMRFLKKENKQPVSNPPSLKAWPGILDALETVWKRVKILGFKHLKLGLLNQDALENFFGCMRSHSSCFVKLNCYQADGVFKTLLINNLISYHAVGSNCLPDYGKGLFALKNFIEACDEIEESDVSNNPFLFENDELPHPQSSIKGRKHCFSFEIKRKLSVLFAKKLLEKHNSGQCAECKKTFFQAERDVVSGDILLNSAMDYFERGFIQATSVCFRILPLICFRRQLSATLMDHVLKKVDFEWMKCYKHRSTLSEMFLMFVIIYCINKWCNHLNRLLNGSSIFHGSSVVEIRAREHYVKYHARIRGANNQ